MLDYLKKLENFFNDIQQRFPTSEQGQSLVLVALFLFFGFLVFAALATDGTILYLRRRQLQSIADGAALAAAIELSQLKSDAVAYQKARDVIEANDGYTEWYSTNPATPNPPSTNVGSGTGLTMGIEITDSCDVRVALAWDDIGTYFAQFVGRDTLQVGANARASCNRSGGLMPIAIKRFGDERDSTDDPIGMITGNPSRVYCEFCNTTEGLGGQGHGDAFDFLGPEGSDEITDWPGWPSDPDQKFESPSTHANPGAPGREYYIIGDGVNPNVSTAGLAFSGPVNLDLRQVSSDSPQTYNGVPVDAQSNTLKPYVENYIRRGYCCDIPKPGDQVGVIAGVSTAFMVTPFQQTYDIGDIVAVIVYDGHVLKNPNFEMTATPDITTTHPTTTTVDSNALVYTIEMDGDSAFQSAFSGINLSVKGLDGFADWAFSDDSPQVGWPGNPDPQTVTLYVTPTLTNSGVISPPTTQVVTGTRMFYVAAYDNALGGTNIRRYWAGIVSIGDEVGGVKRDLPAVTAEPDTPYLSVAKGDPASRIKVDLNLWGIYSDQDVTVTPPATLPQGFSWGNPPPSPDWTETVRSGDEPGATFDMKLKVDNTATASSTPYVIPLTVSSTGVETQTFNLYVVVREGNTTSTDYVVILGYAAIEVMFYDTNSVRARVISELWEDPSQLTYGLRPRLIPWNY